LLALRQKIEQAGKETQVTGSAPKL